MIKDMQLRGLSANTQELYVRAVHQLADHAKHGPGKVTEEELREYFLFLANEKKSARSTTTVALCGIKFFYENTLRRDWPTLRLVRPAPEHKLPVVLSREEVRLALANVRTPVYGACLTTIYSCGLRLMEGAQLQVGDVDAPAWSSTFTARGSGTATFRCRNERWVCFANSGKHTARPSGSSRRRPVAA